MGLLSAVSTVATLGRSVIKTVTSLGVSAFGAGKSILGSRVGRAITLGGAVVLANQNNGADFKSFISKITDFVGDKVKDFVGEKTESLAEAVENTKEVTDDFAKAVSGQSITEICENAGTMAEASSQAVANESEADMSVESDDMAMGYS